MKSIISAFYVLAALALALVFALPQIVQADPPRPRRTYAIRPTWCMADSGSKFFVRAYQNMAYQGTSGNLYWYRVVYPAGSVPLLCPASQMARPTVGR